MRIITKEFHQLKWMLISGCIAGLSFPVVEYFMMQQRRSTIRNTNSGVFIVLCGGAFFGILLAAASTWHDARKGASDFILARPFNCSRIFITKALLAAVLLPLAMLLVSSIDIATNLGEEQGFSLFGLSILSLTWPISVMLFALTMFLVVVTQDAAKSVLMAAWAGLLVYFLPIMLNGFNWLSFFWHMNEMQRSIFALLPESYTRILGKGKLASGSFIENALPYLCFMTTMLAAAAAFTWLAVAAMKKRWRWQPGQKTIVWTMGVALAVIFGQAVFQVGHNLQPLKEIAGRPLAPLAYIEHGQVWDAFCHTDDFRFLVRRIDSTSDDGLRTLQLALYTYRFPWLSDAQPVTVRRAYQTFQAGSLTICTLPPAKPNYTGLMAAGCFVKDNTLCVFYIFGMNDSNEPVWQHPFSMHLAIVDVSDPARPTLRRDEIVGTTKHINSVGFAFSGDHCYINGGDRLIVVSLAKPDEPSVVAELPYMGIVYMLRNTVGDGYFKRHDPPFVNGADFIVSGQFLIAHNPYFVAVFDVTETANPRTILCERKAQLVSAKEGYAGDALAWHDEYCYIANDDGIFVFRLAKGEDGAYSLDSVGRRPATPLERFSDRDPHQLMVHNGYLIEAAGNFGLLVYDISDPASPKRAYHAAVPRCYDIGTWRGLLYAQSSGNEISFFNLPKGR